MKKLIFIPFIVAALTGFSQQVDSLAFLYQISYKSSPKIDGEEKRGISSRSEELRFKKKKSAYSITSTKSLELFYEWDGGFGLNLIKDSLGKPRYLINRRIDGKNLNDFLAEIITIDSNTAFPYTLKDIPKEYLKNHALTDESEKIKVDSLLREEFSSFGMSNVTGHFFIQFNYKGIKYELHKDTNNAFWRIRVDERSIYFFHFAFDAFLREHLPKKFSGLKVLM